VTVSLAAPSYRSHSQLTTFMECGEKYRLKYLEKAKERPSIWLPGGTAFHSATEAFDKGEVDRDGIAAAFTEEFRKEVQAVEEATGVAHHEFRAAGRVSKDKPNKENYDWWLTAGQDMSLEYTTWRANNPHLEVMEWGGVDQIETEFLPILNGVAVKMYIDRLLVDTSNGMPLVMDLKTGSRKLPSLQLGVYRVGIEKVLGLPVDYGAYYMARKGELSPPVLLDNWTEGVIGHLFATMDAQVKAGVFLPRISSDCDSCGVRKQCQYMGEGAA
jgi:hypothetical protein